MNCEQFDEVRQKTMAKYGLGVHAQLLSVSDHAVSTPPGDWLTVTVMVIPVVPNPQPWADEWFYGGLLHSIRKPVPLGVRPIDNQRVISCVEAAQNLPCGFPLPEASGNLFWPLVPDLDEPLYQFVYQETVICIGAYTGRLHKESGGQIVREGILLSSEFPNQMKIGEVGWFVEEWNPSTGESWNWVVDNSARHKIIADITLHSATGVPGVPGLRIWKFQMLLAGDDSLKFRQTQPGKPDNEITVNISVVK